MTLTVRLDETLEAALERYCTATGTSKSLVVQESLATYLLSRSPGSGAAADAPAAAVSANFRAFADAGLVGGVADAGRADKAGVRARIAERMAARAAPAQAGKPGARPRRAKGRGA